MLALKFLDLIDRLFGVPTCTLRAGVLELPSGFFQSAKGGVGLRHGLRSTGRGRLPHGFGGLLEIACGLLKVGVIHLASESLQLARGFFGLISEFTLSFPATALGALVR